MKNKKTPNFFLIVVVLILGQGIYKQFDYENLKFENPALSIIYLIVFGFSIYFLVKKDKSRPEK